MNIKSISELDSRKATVSQLSAAISFVELDVKNQLLDKFKSEKIDFGDFTRQVVEALFQFNEEFERIIAWFYEVLAEIEKEVTRRIDIQEQTMTEFMMRAHGEFLHKSKSWQDAVEVVYHNKFFKDRVSVVGENSLLSSQNVIEGIARGTYYES